MTLVVVLSFLSGPGGPEDPTPAAGADATESAHLSGDHASAVQPTGVQTTQEVLAGCRRVLAGQARALRAADRSLEQWALHVDAMNQLVAGEITLDQAYAFWEESRMQAARRVARFEDAEAAVRANRPDCPREVDAAGEDTTRLRPCVRDANAREEVIALAATPVTTWKHHIHDMERLRMGEITADQATRMWLESWRAGQDELDEYRDAARGAPDDDTC